MIIRRRAILSTAMLFPLALVGCSPKQITIDLTTAQAEAKTIETALGFVVTTLPSPIQAEAKKALNELEAVVSAFEKLTYSSGMTTILSFTQQVITAVSAVLAVVPLPGPTGLAIHEGLAILSALMSGLSTLTVPRTIRAPAVGVGAPAVTQHVVPGPVPVPVPVS